MTTFSTPNIQPQIDAMNAREQTPEFQAKRAAELQQERREFWRTYALLPAAMMVLGISMVWLFNVDALTGVLMIVGLPALAAAILYPKSDDSYHRSVARRERVLKVLGD